MRLQLIGIICMIYVYMYMYIYVYIHKYTYTHFSDEMNINLTIAGRSVDDLVSQIIDRVDLKTEQQKDTEIQSLYAADASVLYTPEAARKIYSPRKNLN
jgi:hypothetical protein